MQELRKIVLPCLMVLLLAACYQAPLGALSLLPAAHLAQAATPTLVANATPQPAATPAVAATAANVTTATSAPAPAAAATPAATGVITDTHLTQCSGQPAATPPPVTGGTPLKDALAKLQPQIVWTNFYTLTTIPRPSGYLTNVETFLKTFGAITLTLPMSTTQDQAGNIVIHRPGSKGMEHLPGVVLQAHMDMVPQAKDPTFDFQHNPIQAYVQGDWVHTDHKTTLGADDGIGIALIMALLQDKDLVAPPITALFTVDEETTMWGIKHLEPNELAGNNDYINVDSEEDGQFTIGSAGGQSVASTLAYQTGAAPVAAARFYTVTVDGLKGGHSGVDINKGRGSATKLLVRALTPALEKYGVRLATLQGGSAYNAIPSSASALVQVPVSQAPAFRDYLKQFEMTVRTELTHTEPSLAVKVMTATLTMTPTVMTPASQTKVLDVLYANPQGVIRMSDVVTGLVETSNNLGVVKTANGLLQATNLSRSSVDSELTDAGTMITTTWELAGGQYAVTDRYPGWNPNPDAELLKIFGNVYYADNKVDACYAAIHAGLECGLVAVSYPQMDMISVGPTLIDVHSPDERVQISAVERAYQLLRDVLGELAKQ
jgi:dipeptidase D